MNDDNSTFNKGTIDEIVKKCKEDKTGRTGVVMQQIMDVSERAGKYGFTLQELSIIATTGWYLSKNPALREFFDNLMNMSPPDEDDEVYN
tara:strand:- start:266 stop:535 length:270 start_codon:yes stop_codon:yes gene_type:complete